MPSSRFERALVAAASLSAHVALGCTVDEDCNLNGVCDLTKQACVCDPGWSGSDCGALDFAPASYGTGYNLTSVGTSSWGGKTIRDPNNPALFHLFVAEFTKGCGLDYWSPMSRIARAEGSSPEGPFTFASEVVGTFAHNPTVIYSPADALWLMYHIGCTIAQPSSCVTPSISCDAGNNINGESSITLRTSPDLYNWTSQGFVLGPDTYGTWDADSTNPSAFPYRTKEAPNSTAILLMYRGCPYNCGGAELLAMSMATTYKGPYLRITGQPILPNNGAEDPHGE